MYVIFEVVKKNYGEQAGKTNLIPVDTAEKAPDADKIIEELTQRLDHNKQIRDRIWSELYHKHNNNQAMLNESDRMKYQALEYIHDVKGYERQLLDDKRIELSNPVGIEDMEPPKPKRKYKKRRKSAKKQEPKPEDN